MRVGIFCGNTKPSDGGAFSFTETLVKSLKDCDDKTVEFVFFYKGNIFDFSKSNMINYLSGLNTIKYKVERLCLRLDLNIKQSVLDNTIKKHKIDLFYFPEAAYEYISYPYIYTIWDIVHRSYPFFPEISLNGLWKKRDKVYERMLPRASYIITGCEAGKKEIEDNYFVNKKSIKIIPFPISNFCFETNMEQIELPNKFFFYPAGFYPEKNHITILKALKCIYDSYSIKPEVVFTGADKGNLNYIKQKIHEYELEDVVLIKGFVSDKQLKYIYSKALALVFASAVGPNNLPPIEGIVCNCPTLASDVEGHIEDIGNGEYIFERYNYKQLADLMYKIYSDEKYRDTILSQQGRIRAKLLERNYIKDFCEIINDFEIKRELWGDYTKNKF